MADTCLAKKLLIKSGHKVAITNPPSGYDDIFDGLHPDTEKVEKLNQPVDVIVLFTKNKVELDKFLAPAIKAIKPDGLLWICYPKRTCKVKTDLNRDILWKEVGESGFAGVSLISLDTTWSAMRFRPQNKVGK